MKQQSFHIDGFWFHLTWNAKGTQARDQHNNIWVGSPNAPVSEFGTLAGPVTTPGKVIPLYPPVLRVAGTPAKVISINRNRVNRAVRICLAAQSLGSAYLATGTRAYPFIRKDHRLCFVAEDRKLSQISSN